MFSGGVINPSNTSQSYTSVEAQYPCEGFVSPSHVPPYPIPGQNRRTPASSTCAFDSQQPRPLQPLSADRQSLPGALERGFRTALAIPAVNALEAVLPVPGAVDMVL